MLDTVIVFIYSVIPLLVVICIFICDLRGD